jgi:exonuclease III
MKLGTGLQKLFHGPAKLLGKENCSGCRQRAELLDRRGFIGAVSLASSGLLALKNSVVKGAWNLAGAQIPVNRDATLGFVRAVNQVQVSSFYERGRHATTEEFLGANGVPAHREHFKPGELGYVWMSNLNVFSDEVLPGWRMDFALTKGLLNNKVYKLGSARYSVASARLYGDGDEGETSGSRATLASRVRHVE